ERNPAPMDSMAEKAAFLDIFTAANQRGAAPGNLVEDGCHVHGGELGGYRSIALYVPRSRVAGVVYTNDGRRIPSLPDLVASDVKAVLDRRYGETGASSPVS